ncbi:MAG: MFS transporter [Robiginitalea sp.]|uniref:MFS transporter n=1 Tax=Robiginitalea sp. TaxID=1902411 RepID=UPI003C75B778
MYAITTLFNKLFDIKPGEIRKAVLLQAYVFLLITTLLIVKPTINSIFLSALTSEALPTAYLLTAVVAVLFSLFYDKILWAIPLNRVITGTLVLCALVFAIFCLLLNFKPSNTGWLYAPYLFVAIFGLLTTSQFWILANLIFNVREAKRLFGFIGSGAIAGGIFGGYLTSLLSGIISSENLLLVAAALILVCIPISSYLWKRYVDQNKVQKPIKEKAEQTPFTLIRRNRLLWLITLTVGISVVVAKMVDYQYSHFAAEKITNTEELTSFFGFWFSTLSVVSLLIQLFLSKRILKYFGIGNALIFMPVGILLGSILLLLIPELWVVVAIKIVEGSLKQSLNKAASELVIIPVPIEVRKHAKPFIDIVVDSIATGLAGAILIFLINGMGVPSIYISYINIGLIAIWIFLITRIFKAYQDSFRRLLVKEHPKVKKHEKHHLEVHNESVFGTINRVLTTGKESQILYMLEEILRSPDEHYFDAVRSLLHHPSSPVRSLSVKNLYYLNSADLRTEMKELLNDPSDDVVIDVLRYLIHKDHDLHREEILDYEEHSNHANIRALTLLAVAQEVHTDTHLKEVLQLEARVDALLEHAGQPPWDAKRKFDVIAAIEAIGHTRLESRYKIVYGFLQDSDPQVLTAAFDSIAQIGDERFIPGVAAQLHVKELRKEAITCLQGYGPSIIPVLKRMVENQDIHLDDALFVPDVFRAIGTTEAVSTLVALVDSAEYAVSVKAIQILKMMKKEAPELEIESELIAEKILQECQMYQKLLSFLHTQVSEHDKDPKTEQSTKIRMAREGLISILKHRVDAHLERIFNLLGIHYFEQDVEPILELAVNGDDQQRANAIEFIDSILEARLRHVLVPIIDSLGQGVVYSEEMVAKLKLPSISEWECFKNLLTRHDAKIKHAVLYLIEQLEDHEYDPLIEPLLQSPSESVRKQAEQVLKKR